MVPKRLKAARERAGLTQTKLGTLAGIDSSGRARMSQYEKGTHSPTFQTVCAIAKVLDVPEAYFYTLDDNFAEALLYLHQAFRLAKPAN